MQDLFIIACVSQDGGLGYANQLLWRIPEDVAFFKQTTMGSTVVMGRKTFESIGNPLPGRTNVVLSRQEIKVPGIYWCQSPADLDRFLQHAPGKKFIIGGASLYQMYLLQAAKIYLTEVSSSKPSDTYFPDFDHSAYDRQVLQSGQTDGIDYQIVVYVKREL